MTLSLKRIRIAYKLYQQDTILLRRKQHVGVSRNSKATTSTKANK